MSFWVLGVWSSGIVASTAQATPPVPGSVQRAARPLESWLARTIFTQTDEGIALLSRLTARSGELPVDYEYEAFLERLSWSSNHALSRQLNRRIAIIEQGLKQERAAKGLSELPASEELLTDQEIVFLQEQAARELKASHFDDIFNTIQANSTQMTPARDRYKLSMQPRPSGNNTPVTHEIGDLSELRLKWYERFGDTASSVWNIVKRLKLPIRSHYTPEDVVVIRKYNHVLDAMNEYARMRELMRGFAKEPAHAYLTLNRKTTSAIRTFLNDGRGIERLVRARELTAKNMELQLNPITFEGERRILQILERCRSLGGGKMGAHQPESAILIAERDLSNLRRSRSNLEKSVGDTEKEITLLQGQLENLRTARKSNVWREKELTDRLKGRETWLAQEKGNLIQVRYDLDRKSRMLADLYAEFVSNYERVELFNQLRNGRIYTEEVQIFDMAEPFVAQKEELAAWDEIYDRALRFSADAQVGEELKLFVRTRLGETKKVRQTLRDLASQFFDPRVAETAIGTEFRKMERNLVTQFVSGAFQAIGVKPLLATTGIVTAATAAIIKYRDSELEKAFGVPESSESKESESEQKKTGGTVHTLPVPPRPSGDQDSTSGAAGSPASSTDAGVSESPESDDI